MIRTRTDPPHTTARVLIVDDHPAVREGLGLWIARQHDLEVCGEASDVAGALELVSALSPDVAVVDIVLQNGNGIDLLKRIRARDPSVRLLVWSMHPDDLYAERALRAGAMGYINKEASTDKVIDAIRRVLDGRVYLSEAMADRLLHRTVGGGTASLNGSPVASLSDRELEVFELIGQGLDTQRIAQQLCLSPRTVETYRARIKEKLEVDTGVELIREAVQWIAEGS